VWALTADKRLALLSHRELWIATVGDDDGKEVTAVEMQRLDLDSETARVSLTETHYGKWDERAEIAYAWRFSFDGSLELRFEAREPYKQGVQSEDPAVVFGWRLAEKIGWTRAGGEPLIAVK
jgi:hypothetical protein